MAKNPLVSIVIRTKNESKFVGKVLKLLYKQTFKDFEIIIVDSGSTDYTLKIVKKFPVRIIEIPPEGYRPGKSLNIGISKAKGKYICILSGHSIPITDTWLSDGLKVLKEKKVAAVTGYYSELALGYIFRPIWRFAFSAHRFRQNNIPWITNSNSMIRKDLWEKYHFDESLCSSEDYDWGKEMLNRGFNVVKYKPFSVFHSHTLIGRPGYWQSRAKWKKWNAVIDRKVRS